MQNLYGQAKDAARDATDAATGYARRVYSESGDGTEAVSRMVQENPVSSLLLAGGIGFALAALLLQAAATPPGTALALLLMDAKTATLSLQTALAMDGQLPPP